jgi:hypothetical protein
MRALGPFGEDRAARIVVAARLPGLSFEDEFQENVQFAIDSL